MNLRIVRSVLLIAALMSVMVAATGLTMASWNDTATSSGNTFKSGNMDLRQSVEPFGQYGDDPIVSLWSAHDMYPGQELGPHMVYFQNNGSILGSSFRIATSNTNRELARYIEVSALSYRDGDWHNLLDSHQPVHLTDADHDGRLTLNDMQEAALEGLPVPNTVGAFYAAFRFSSSAGNETRNRSDIATFRFTLQQ
jgi:predicted ribosomally synthesized peptide with SipW-like signal peptide